MSVRPAEAPVENTRPVQKVKTDEGVLHITVTSPVNIAVIKYWGKRDVPLMIPLNDSLSGTLHQDDLKTTTSIKVGASLKENRLVLNGKEEDFQGKRLQRLLGLAKQYGTVDPTKNGTVPMVIDSVNDFPTAAGLASSASGYAALAFALCQLFNVQNIDPSCLARMGSGSASRSIYGGWVAWIAGHDMESSKAEQVAPETTFTLPVVILVASAKAKETPSSSGMQQSVKTSKSLAIRAKDRVPPRMEAMRKAVLSQDFKAFAELTMVDSDDFHTICEKDTTPPIVYMNEVSHNVVSLVRAFNDFFGEPRLAYTFDAGPNACIYCRDMEAVEYLLPVADHFFPPSNPQEGYYNTRATKTTRRTQVNELIEAIAKKVTIMPDGLARIIQTVVGPGPQIIESNL